MTRTIVAILALSSGVLLAQTSSPAQLSSTPMLKTSIVQPVAAAANRPDVTPTPYRTSTGVIPPKLVYAAQLDSTHAALARTMERDQTMIIDMTVNKDGKPENLHVAQSIDPFTDNGVLDAVSQFRFKPASLNGSPIAIPVTIRYVIK